MIQDSLTALKEQNRGVEELHSLVIKIEEISELINRQSNEQLEGGKEVVKGVEYIEQLSQEVVEAMENQRQETKAITQNADNLLDISTTNKEFFEGLFVSIKQSESTISELVPKVKHFKFNGEAG